MEIDGLDERRDFLEHYGVKGMKWGVRKERQTSGKEKTRRSQRAKNRVARLRARSEKQTDDAKKKAEREKEKKEQERKEILSDPTKLYKHRKEYTADEIQSALRQFKLEKELSDYSKSQLKNGADFINTLFSYTNNSINLYNAAARIANSVGEKPSMPIIKTTSELIGDKKNKNKKD